VLGFASEDGSMSDIDLGDYVAANVQDYIARVNGVGETQLFGSKYAMRIWLDPAKLQKYKLTPADISAAITAQNTQVTAGQLGALPAVKGQRLNATVTAQSRMQTPDQFGAIVLNAASSWAVSPMT